MSARGTCDEVPGAREVIRDDRVVQEPTLEVAARLAAEGRVVPGLTVSDDGRARSWRWPLPAARHRRLVTGLVAGASEKDRPRAAEELAEAVADPWLPASLDPAKVLALAAEVDRWMRSGAVVTGEARLCLRLHEPRGSRAPWQVEVLAQDRDEPSLVVGVGDLVSGRSPLGPGAAETVLAALGRMVRLARELAGALDQAEPDRIDVDDRTVVALARDRLGDLEGVGIGVLLPAWWSRRPRLGVRARVASGSSGPGGSGGPALGEVFRFSWEAALDDRRLTKADLAALTRAAAAERSLVRVRGQWIEVDAGQWARSSPRSAPRAMRRPRSCCGPASASAVWSAASTSSASTPGRWDGSTISSTARSTVACRPSPRRRASRAACARTRREASAGWCSSGGWG